MMKIKQSTIMSLIGEIKSKLEESGKEVVEYTLGELLESLKMTETYLEYNGGEEILYHLLVNQKQFDWNKIGCVPMYKCVYFINYDHKDINGNYETDADIVLEWIEKEAVAEILAADDDDLDFWYDLGYSKDDLE